MSTEQKFLEYQEKITDEKLMHKCTDSEGQYQGNLNVYEKKHGFGSCEFSNGNFYIGQYTNDEFHGVGFWQFKNGAYYYGDFEDSCFDGKGEFMQKSYDKLACR